jgi:hypothetical protein
VPNSRFALWLLLVLALPACWDADYDWRSHVRRHPGAVPRIIVDLTFRQ